MTTITIERQTLLPCPFCGDDGDKGRQEVTQMIEGRNKFTRITCRACGAMCPEENWNRRAALAAQPAVLLESTRAWSRAIAQEERACRAEDALVDLVNQIRKTSPIDDHGHDLTMNMAYLKAVELLDDPPQPRKDDHGRP